MRDMSRHLLMLIVLINLAVVFDVCAELDLKDIIGSNSSDENAVLRKLLLHVVLELKEVKLQLKQFMKKDELDEIVRNITEVTDSRSKTYGEKNSLPFINSQYNMKKPSTNIEAPVVPATNMTTMEQILKLLVRRSCFDWRQSGFTQSGMYTIDPDGAGIGDAPITVYCDMITGFTFLRHNMEGQIEAGSCTGQMCYKGKLIYEASDKQIESLIEMSQSCQQFVKVDCFESPFQTREGYLGWWKGRDGLQHYEWAGEDYPDHICTCGQSGSCVNPMKSCNCDADIPNVWVSDSGYVSNHSALPVREVIFGTKNDDTPLQMRYSVGPLRCYGSRSLSYPTSCHDVFLRGSVRNGWYVLGTPQSLRFAYCGTDSLYQLYSDHNSSLELPAESLDFEGFNFDELIIRSLQSKGFILLKEEQLNNLTMNTAKQQNDLKITQNLVKNNEHDIRNLYMHVETLQLNITNQQTMAAEKKINIAFHADSKKDHTFNPTRFEEVRVNEGDGYDPASGKFTTPVSGVYYIVAYARKNTEANTWFYLRKNENVINIAYSAAGRFTGLAIAAIVQLNEGDDVDVYLASGTFYGSTRNGLSFLGYLLYEA